MAITCNRCQGSGFLNVHQLPIDSSDLENVVNWINDNSDHDVQVCDCCGDGCNWYGVPGEHYNDDDPGGQFGPYDYNGGFCECH